VREKAALQRGTTLKHMCDASTFPTRAGNTGHRSDTMARSHCRRLILAPRRHLEIHPAARSSHHSKRSASYFANPRSQDMNSSPAQRPVKIPGPDHPITVEGNGMRVLVKVDGRTVADTHDALTLREAHHAAVQYIPRKDVDMALLSRTDHVTYCPYKGECHYFSIEGVGERGINAVWTYETPYDAVARIKDHLAFYSERVDAIELLDH
jgi:uncharacterized protein (DUF427 family)